MRRSPMSRWRRMRVRSRPGRPQEESAPPNTTSCCASRMRWGTAPATQERGPFRGSVRERSHEEDHRRPGEKTIGRPRREAERDSPEAARPAKEAESKAQETGDLH